MLYALTLLVLSILPTLPGRRHRLVLLTANADAIPNKRHVDHATSVIMLQERASIRGIMYPKMCCLKGGDIVSRGGGAAVAKPSLSVEKHGLPRFELNHPVPQIRGRVSRCA